MRDRILALVAEACDSREAAENPKLDLYTAELLDSLAFIRLLELLEDELGVEIQPTQVNRECWRTPGSIVALVEKIQKGESF